MIPEEHGMLRTLDALRLRLRIARFVETAVRWTFYASFLACVCLAAGKLGWRPGPSLLPVLLALPIAASILPLVRRTTRLEAAIALDRTLELDERVATALETRQEVVVRDAGRALAGKDSRRAAPVRLPREAALLAFALPLAVALAVVASPDRPAGSPESGPLARAAEEEARALKALALPPELAGDLDRIVKELSSGDRSRITAALAALDALQADVNRRAIEGGDGAAGLAEAADRLSASGSALGRFAPRVALTPGALAEKLNHLASTASGDRSSRPRDFAIKVAPAGSAAALAAEQAIGETLSRRDWDARYDDVVQPYFKVTR